MGLFISYEENEVFWIQPLGPYSQHYIFFVSYKSAQLARAFVTGKLLQPGVIEYSSLFGLFVSVVNTATEVQLK
jgi:hypothetical protein